MRQWDRQVGSIHRRGCRSSAKNEGSEYLPRRRTRISGDPTKVQASSSERETRILRLQLTLRKFVVVCRKDQNSGQRSLSEPCSPNQVQPIAGRDPSLRRTCSNRY